ncbi:prefoldin subunit 2 isoform X2 [Phycodurus eques]|uniref:prefoldin subunit 2 isoform X2 n=1 Tax=Phycodurus eques TaxID=693459 RepID=UPI002ACED572|nr:prefoldin subunit 2 isoform X2 [Phycodurus eques]
MAAQVLHCSKELLRKCKSSASKTLNQVPSTPSKDPRTAEFVACLVIDTLKDVDPSRKCFRLVGGVLVERTVKEVLPALQTNKDQISKILESISTKMQEKGRELTEYRERYNIRLVGEGEAQGQSTESSKDSEGGGSKSGAGVLVS